MVGTISASFDGLQHMADEPGAKSRRAAVKAPRPAASISPETGEVTSVSRRIHERDRLLGFSALFMSVLSLLIAYNQTRMMRQQVAAASWPLLKFTSGNTGPGGAPLLDLIVQNAGVGPAVVKRFEYRYRGRTYNNIWHLLQDCCDYRVLNINPTIKATGVPLTSFVEGTVIRPGESTTLLEMPLSADNQPAWVRLDKARFQFRFDACYCSVLGECWHSDLVSVEPEKVDNCPPARPNK